MANERDLKLILGKTFSDVIRWGLTAPVVRKPIVGTGVTWPNGTARIEATGHGLVNGWPVAVTGLKTMPALNALDPNKIRDSEYHPATVISPDIIELNDVNASEFKAWVSGGFIQYHTPVSLATMSARMSVKARQGESNLLRCSAITTGIAGATKPEAAGVDGGVTWAATAPPLVATKEWVAGATFAVNDVIDTKSLLFLTVGNGRIAIDDALKTISRTIAASHIAGLSWKSGYYDIEAFTSDATPVVTLLEYGKITISTENTK